MLCWVLALVLRSQVPFPQNLRIAESVLMLNYCIYFYSHPKFTVVIENDITIDDKLISVIQGAKVGNTKRGAIYGDQFRWEKTVKNGKQIVIVPYKLEGRST